MNRTLGLFKGKKEVYVIVMNKRYSYEQTL